MPFSIWSFEGSDCGEICTPILSKGFVLLQAGRRAILNKLLDCIGTRNDMRK
jgi:hypothetical protein